MLGIYQDAISRYSHQSTSHWQWSGKEKVEIS